ncbi:hypothetical protein Patl1_35159 [Pistacia atlantica]|uniref:Uncharacterized protein n=1 Tax=Pistacia atlantica TaxID=434234 RepID=A0ACC0ZQY7_9ROSI|nr:hypothetical protein Patl1_35159 [Pistacia atlantica]
MKMVGGDYTLRATAQCFVLFLTIFACVYLEKDLMVVKIMLVQEQENGFSIMVVQQQFHLGERLGLLHDSIKLIYS